LQAVDLLIEVRDARLPISSVHPKAGEIFGNKPKLIVLAKEDLAESKQVKGWLTQLGKTNDQEAIALSLKIQKGRDKLLSLALKVTEAKRQALARKGLLPRPMRACVVGLPNVGKSSFINWLIGKRKTRTGDKPGITRGTQWVRVHPQLELLDTPGILPATAFNRDVSLKLALCNLIPEAHYDNEDIAEFGLSYIASTAPSSLKIYGSPLDETQPTLQNLAVARGCLAAGAKPDVKRAAALFLNDFRDGKLGPIMLDQI
jgi:ribosome biogenesis GTPase A